MDMQYAGVSVFQENSMDLYVFRCFINCTIYTERLLMIEFRTCIYSIYNLQFTKGLRYLSLTKRGE